MMGMRRAGDRQRWFRNIFGALLAIGGLVHMWLHGQWGVYDWGAIVVIVLGCAIISPEAIRDLVRAWRGGKDETDGAGD